MYKAKKILSSVIIALLVLTSVFGIIGVGYYTDWFSDFEKSESEVLSSGGLVVTVDEEHNDEVIQSGEGIIIQSLKLASVSQSTGDNFIRKSLVATVYPEDAPDKTVLWSLCWGANPKEQDVFDYVYIEETESNNVVNIVCKQNFSDSTVIVYCQTLVGGWRASCVCSFKGAPEDLIISHDGENLDHGSSIDLVAGTYLFDLNLTNALGSIGSDYQNPNYSVVVSGYGRWSMDCQVSLDGSPFTALESKYDIDVLYNSTSEAVINNYPYGSYPTIRPADEAEYASKWGSDSIISGSISLPISTFVECEIVDNRLRIDILNDPKSFVLEDRFILGGDTFVQRRTFKEYKSIGQDSVESLSLHIVVIDNNSGVGSSFYIRPQPGGVSGLSISSEELIF